MNVFYFGADLPWEELTTVGFRRRNTCILKALVESNLTKNVFVVRKVTRRHYLRSLIKKKELGKDKVKDVIYTSLVPERFLSISFLNFINSSFSSFLIRQACAYRKEDDIIWCYWPNGYKSAVAAGLKGKLVFDADHNIIDDPNLAEPDRIDRHKLLLDIGRKADYILSSVRSMMTWYRNYGIDKGYRLRNGVDLDRFSTLQNDKNVSHFTIGYCGTLSKWINYTIFAQLARRNPNWRFVVVGKAFKNNDWEQLKGIENVELVGEKSANEVAKLLPSFDAALNLYHPHQALDVDSMKIYEYLASGVPVVSTRFHDHLTEDFNNLLHLADSLEEIEYQLKEIEMKKEVYRIENVRLFLQESSWLNRVEHFLRSISFSN